MKVIRNMGQITESDKWPTKYRVLHTKILRKLSRIQIQKNYFDILNYVKLLFLYLLGLLCLQLSGNLTPGASESRLPVGDSQKLHFVDTRWRDSTVIDRYTKKLRFTFSLPPGPTGVCINLIEGLD